jgi:hypothetical protein
VNGAPLAYHIYGLRGSNMFFKDSGLGRSTWLSLMAAALATTAAAQHVKPISSWENLNGLVRGTEIRVTLTNGTTVHGFLQSVTADTVAINAAVGQPTLRQQDIRRVATRRAGHRGRNTLIGLGVGTAVGLGIGAAFDAKVPDYWFPNAGKAIASPLGALFGTVIGVVLPTGGWRDVYRAP